ncbi:MAG: TVP38/TMEM64 family protein [Chloroflexota bacterium]
MSSNLLKRLAIVAVILALVAAFKLLHLDQYLTLEYLKSSQESFSSLYAARPTLVIGSYMAIYILVTSLSLPGAAVLTLAGGALFGFIAGTVIVSFASSIGATLACLVARFLLRDWVQGKFGERLTTVNQGIDREGAFYLFTLRLIPIFPFFVINLVMGLTKMPVLTFYWVSQVGMIPGTMVYVNAGRELARIESLSGILSPGLIASFVLIGVFPLITKKVLSLYRAKRGTHT